MGANEYATGRGLQDPEGTRESPHTNTPGQNAITRDGTADCTPGQQGYAYGANKHDPTEDRFYKRAVVDQLNGAFEDAPKGSTFQKFDKEGKGTGPTNAPRVPEGQTFTDIPGGRANLTDYDKDLLKHR